MGGIGAESMRKKGVPRGEYGGEKRLRGGEREKIPINPSRGGGKGEGCTVAARSGE